MSRKGDGRMIPNSDPSAGSDSASPQTTSQSSCLSTDESPSRVARWVKWLEALLPIVLIVGLSFWLMVRLILT